MKDRAELEGLLKKAAKKAGKGKPLGMGSMFWLDVRWHMREMGVVPETRKGMIKKRVGMWKGHALRIIPGSIDSMLRSKPGMNDPRPWAEVKA